MLTRRNLCLLALVTITALPTCLSFSLFRGRIPNGYEVPNPCNQQTWRGVGHFLEEGAGARNLFGEDFKKHKFEWNKKLCEEDSDGDGLTNGHELGDPTCIWKKGSTATLKAIGHPGICEPITDKRCIEKNNKFNCKNSKCATKQDSGVKEFVLKLHNVTVPDRETTYMCMYYNLSDHGVDLTKTYHVIGYEPVIDNVDVTHHILIFKCNGKENIDKRLFECDMSPSECFTIFGGWTIGMGQSCAAKNVGFRIGRDAISTMVLQIHWNNPEKIRSSTDGSGIRFYYVEKLRQYNADIIMLGAINFNIPPSMRSCAITADCHGLNNGSIYVTNVINHMHLLGKEIKIEHRRHGKLIRKIVENRKYSYNTPKLFKFDKVNEVKPRDDLKLFCCYSSKYQNSTTSFGLSTFNEMCLTFLVVFPSENVSKRRCFDQSYQECKDSGDNDFCTNKSADSYNNARITKTNLIILCILVFQSFISIY